jgi:hypothetical protein
MDPFNSLTEELRAFTVVVSDGSLSPPNLRRVLIFVVKASQVAEQAIQDIVTVLIDIKYLDIADLDTSRLRDLQKRIDLLNVRSHCRDVEELCSRLHYLSEQYVEKIAPLVKHIADAQGWQGMLGLLNEHEGRLINLVHQVIYDLKERLSRVDAESLIPLNQFAAAQLDMLMRSLDDLRELSNSIFGASGTPWSGPLG